MESLRQSFYTFKMVVEKKYLIGLAGIVWMLAGFMVVKTGLPLFIQSGRYLLQILLSCTIFLIFYFLIFSRLVKKHVQRISADERKRMPVLEFFDTKSYIIMVVMITGGITIRKLQLMPLFFIGFFYVGLGIALFLAGVMFLYNFFTYP